MIRRIIFIVFAGCLSLTAPATHAASLAQNLQGTYKLIKISSAINGVADRHPKGIPSPAPTFAVNAQGFGPITGSSIVKFFKDAGLGSTGLKVTITSASAAAFGSTTSGKVSFYVYNPDGPDHLVTITISTGQIKGTIKPTGLTFTSSMKGPGTIAGKTQNYTLAVTLTLTKK
jgi:hypothetical protein